MAWFWTAFPQGKIYDALTVVLVTALIVLAATRRTGGAFVVFLAVAFFVWINRPTLDSENTTLRASMTGLTVTIAQAQATISQMQMMAGLLGETVIDVDRFSGVLGGVPANLRKEHRAEVWSILAAIGAGSDATHKVTEAEHNQEATERLETALLTGIKALASDNKQQVAFSAAYDAAYRRNADPAGLFPPDPLRKLFQQFNVTDPAALKALNDYAAFYNDPTKVED